MIDDQAIRRRREDRAAGNRNARRRHGAVSPRCSDDKAAAARAHGDLNPGHTPRGR
jgi:hypothetical protein